MTNTITVFESLTYVMYRSQICSTISELNVQTLQREYDSLAGGLMMSRSAEDPLTCDWFP